MRVLVTGGVGVLGRTLLPLLETAGHEISAPGPQQLDLLDAGQVGAAIACVQGVYHLATRIPPPDRTGDREAWRENDRLRADVATPGQCGPCCAGRCLRGTDGDVRLS